MRGQKPLYRFMLLRRPLRDRCYSDNASLLSTPPPAIDFVSKYTLTTHDAMLIHILPLLITLLLSISRLRRQMMPMP